MKIVYQTATEGRHNLEAKVAEVTRGKPERKRVWANTREDA